MKTVYRVDMDIMGHEIKGGKEFKRLSQAEAMYKKLRTVYEDNGFEAIFYITRIEVVEVE